MLGNTAVKKNRPKAVSILRLKNNLKLLNAAEWKCSVKYGIDTAFAEQQNLQE